MNKRELFLRHVAQTSPAPLGLEIVKASGSTLRDAAGKKYLDLIAGISVCNVGHRHPKVVKAIKKQLNNYMHLLVYGEMIETPQVQYAKWLTDHLPASLNSVYFTNSGAEATEGAMKLAKRVTNRTQIIAFNKSYHGSTQGALSIMGDEYWRNAFRPLLPDVLHLEYDSFESLQEINTQTACVIAETIQAERGVVAPTAEWMAALQQKCKETGTLLVLDEIQTGFGRTGTLWGFEQFNIVPDIVLMGKALGGGMPLGAFAADRTIMQAFTENPVLGHITTFGGHPVSCAAGLTAFRFIKENNLASAAKEKEALMRKLLPGVTLHGKGLLLALELGDFDRVQKVIHHCLENGVITDWFLFNDHCIRIAPPLVISDEEIQLACDVLRRAMEA